MAGNQHTKKTAAEHGEKMSLSDYLSSFSGPIVFFLVILSMIFVMSVFFRVSEIEVEGNVHYTDEEIILAVDVEEGDNMFFFDRFATLSRVFAKLPYVEEVSVDLVLPNKVIISVTESEALAYIVLGDEMWTIDHSCKILGKATDDEIGNLIPIIGLSPGTLMIGETLQTADGDTELVNYLAEVLSQLEDRGMDGLVGSIDFSNKNHVEFTYNDKYTVRIGDAAYTEHKFGMLVSVLTQLLEGDIGIIDLSDAKTAHFIPT